MPFEAIEALDQAETTVRNMLSDAAAAAKQRLASVREEGEHAVEEAVQKADQELAELSRSTDEKAKAAARDLADNNANRKAALLAKAEARAEKATAFVVERIVNSHWQS